MTGCTELRWAGGVGGRDREGREGMPGQLGMTGCTELRWAGGVGGRDREGREGMPMEALR
jgi:hypothetical protein